MANIICPKCKLQKTTNDFYYRKKDNKKISNCISCCSIIRKENYKRNSIKEKEYAANIRVTLKEYCKEYDKNYAANNREAINENRRRNYKNNPSKIKASSINLKNKDRVSYLFYKAKSRAKIKNIEFNIEKLDLILNDTCPVLKIPYDFTGKNRWLSPSIDRIDNSKGYVKGNVIIISYRANSLKRDGSLEEFEKLLNYLKTIDNHLVEYTMDKKLKQKGKRLLNLALQRAKKINITYNLSKQDKKDLCNRIPTYCPVFGFELLSKTLSGKQPNTISIDRIDNSKGYELNNLMFCSYRANILKSNGTIEEFEKLIMFLKEYYFMY